MGETSIEWTDRTWNPVRGCSRVSEGCQNCYAERIAARFSKGRGAKRQSEFQGFAILENGKSRWTGKVELVESKLTEPLHWRKPCRVFVNSMSDLFHEALPDQAIDRVFAVMALAPQHTFQLLTKRADRMLKWSARMADAEGEPMWVAADSLNVGASSPMSIWSRGDTLASVQVQPWPLANVWLGVSVEDQKTADERIPLLLQTPAAKRFVSYEPALGPVDFRRYLFHHDCDVLALDCEGAHDGGSFLDWVIVGGESGPGARPFDIAWARNTITQCKAAGVACFVKQLGARPGYQRKDGWRDMELRDRKGSDPSQWPDWAFVRGYPQ